MSEDKLDDLLRDAKPIGIQNLGLESESSQSTQVGQSQVITTQRTLTLKQQVKLTKKTFKSAGYLATLEMKRVSPGQIQLHLLVRHLNTKKDGKIAGEGTLLLPNVDPTFQNAEFVAAVNFGEAETLGAKFNSMISGNVGGLIQNVFSIINQVNVFKLGG